MDKKVLIAIDDYYKIPVRDLLGKLLNSDIEIVDTGGFKLNDFNLKLVKKINPSIKIINYIKYKILIRFVIYLLNDMQMYIRENIGFEINDGSYDRIIMTMNNNIHKDENIIDMLRKYFYYRERFNNIALDKPKKTIKLAVISRDYIPNRLYYDFTLEKLLAVKNMQPIRYINNPITNKFKYIFKTRKNCDAVLFLYNRNNYHDITISILLEKMYLKEKITFFKLDFENINEEKLENNINAFYDILNLNK